MNWSLTDHHRRPQSLGGTRSKRNIIRIKENLHRSWHTLFQALPPEEIAKVINAIYLDPDWKFIAVKRKMRGG